MILDKYPEDSFMAIFWKQQKHAASLKNAKSMKWEAAMIRYKLELCGENKGQNLYELFESLFIMSISEGDPQNFYQFEGLAASNHYRGRNLTCCLKLRASN